MILTGEPGVRPSKMNGTLSRRMLTAPITEFGREGRDSILSVLLGQSNLKSPSFFHYIIHLATRTLNKELPNLINVKFVNSLQIHCAHTEQADQRPPEINSPADWTRALAA